LRPILCWLPVQSSSSIVVIFRTEMAKKSSIQEKYSYLISNLRVDPILPYLRDLNWLTIDEYETVSSQMLSRQQKAEKILLLQPRKTIGDYNGEEILVKSIIWSGQGNLIRNLGYADREIQQMLSQRPSHVEPDLPQCKCVVRVCHI